MGQRCTKLRPRGTTVAIVDLLLGSWWVEPWIWALQARIEAGVGAKAYLPVPIWTDRSKSLRFCSQDYSRSMGEWTHHGRDPVRVRCRAVGWR